MTKGTLIVDQAGPSCQSPQVMGAWSVADGADRDAHLGVQTVF